MRLLVVILLAGLLSLFAALAAAIASSALVPCANDAAGCGMGEAYRIFSAPAYVLIAMMAFGIAAAGRDRERAVRITMKVLLLVPLFLVAFGLVSDFSAGKSPRSSDILEALQLAAAFWAAVLVQWYIVRDFLSRRAEPPVAVAAKSE